MFVERLWRSIKYEEVGADWIMEGDMMSAITRSATVTTMETTISKSLPADIPLIDDESTAPKHFRWVVRPGTPLELDGPAGTHFRLEAA